MPWGDMGCICTWNCSQMQTRCARDGWREVRRKPPRKKGKERITASQYELHDGSHRMLIVHCRLSFVGRGKEGVNTIKSVTASLKSLFLGRFLWLHCRMTKWRHEPLDKREIHRQQGTSGAWQAGDVGNLGKVSADVRYDMEGALIVCGLYIALPCIRSD